MRTVAEWIGETSDTGIPPRVKVRVFDRSNGSCAHCGVGIRGSLLPEFDHIISLINHGENRESNLQLLCAPCHRLKTNTDVREKAIVARKRKKHLGIEKRSSFRGWRRMNGEIVWNRTRGPK
jgi:5-methylcytosine-specific restriction enzyme A